MDEDYKVSVPIYFNCWKHHAGFIVQQIKTVNRIDMFDEIKFHMLKIGESQMDLYIGNYSPAEISK